MANVETITKILEIQFNNGELVNGMKETALVLQANKKEMEADNAALKALEKRYKEGKITLQQYIETKKRYAEYSIRQQAQNKALQTQMQAYQRELQNNIKEELAAEGSIKKLRAQVARLTTEWEKLSKAEREGARGKEMQKHIASLNAEINSASMSINNFKDNIGNYEQSIISALGSTNSLSGAASSLGSQFMSMASKAGPWGLAIAAAVAAITVEFKLLKIAADDLDERMNESERGLYLYEQASVSLRAEEEAQKKILDKTTAAWAALKATVNEATASTWRSTKRFFVGMALDYIPLVPGQQIANMIYGSEEEIQALKATYEPIMQDIADKQQEFREKERVYILENAKLEDEIATKREIASNKAEYSAEQRAQALKDAEDAINKLYENRIDQKQLELEIQSLLNSMNDTSTEEKKKEVQLEADLFKLEAARSTQLRGLRRQQNGINTELAKSNDDAERAAAAAERAAAKAEQERQQRTQRQLAAEQTLAKLQEQVRTKSRDAELEALDNNLKIEGAKIQEQIDKINATELLKRQELENKKQQLVKEGKVAEAAIVEQEISELADKELATKQMLEDAKTLLTEKGARQRAAIEARWDKKEFDNRVRQRELEMQTELADIDPNDRRAYLQKQAEQAMSNVDFLEEELLRIKNLSESDWSALYGSELDWQRAIIDGELAVQKAKQRTSDLNREIFNENVRIAKQQLDAVSDVVGGISDLLEAAGEENEAFAQASKVIALAEIAINTGKAIAAAVASSMSAPYPANIIATAQSVATVLANIAAAISTVKAAKFADGGLVVGPGTGTSDSIPARLSNGEAVMTAKAVQDWGSLLSMMNVSSGGNPIVSGHNVADNSRTSAKLMQQMFAEALKEMPNQKVAVVDINRVQRKVQVMDRISKL